MKSSDERSKVPGFITLLLITPVLAIIFASLGAGFAEGGGSVELLPELRYRSPSTYIDADCRYSNNCSTVGITGSNNSVSTMFTTEEPEQRSEALQVIAALAVILMLTAVFALVWTAFNYGKGW